MDENESPKNILWTNPGGQRGRGRPKSRWIDGVEKDSRKLGCRNWLAAAQDRGRWRHLLEDAKAHQGLQSRCWWWCLHFQTCHNYTQVIGGKSSLNSSAYHEKNQKYFRDNKAVLMSCYITSAYVRNFQVSVETCTRSGRRDLSRQLQRTKWRVPYTTNR